MSKKILTIIFIVLFPLCAFAKNEPIRDVIIVIDPGHGGMDPGAIGLRGTREKDIVLAIAKKFQTLVDAEPGMHAVMTRSRDVFIPLRGRLAIARKAKADIFIAIHADAYKNRHASGASVFVLSKRGASSEAARWLANRENISELMIDEDLLHRPSTSDSRVLGMTQAQTQERSDLLGVLVLKAFGKLSDLHRYHVEQAGFVVLKSPDIPSILVETGFISNYMEELQLRSAAYQGEIAQTLLLGVKQYLLQQPPADTIFAALKKGSIIYTIKSGDSLSSLAKRYHTTVLMIKKINGLSSDRLAVGQRLTLPLS